MKRLFTLLALLLCGPAFAQVMGKPASPVTFNPAVFGANSTPAPDSYYHIDEGTGTTLTNIGKDAGSYDGTITGADWTTDDGSTVLRFITANSDKVEFALPGITAFPFTVAVWAEIVTTGSGGDLISVGNIGTAGLYHSITTAATDRVGVRSDDGTTTANQLAAPIAASNILDVYHLVVAAFDSSTSKRIYAANDASGTLTTSIGFGTGINAMRLGMRANSGGASPADVHIAGAAVWKGVALTAAQIQTDLYNGGAWPPFVTTEDDTRRRVILMRRRGRL
jgi:hypothetical protein